MMLLVQLGALLYQNRVCKEKWAAHAPPVISCLIMVLLNPLSMGRFIGHPQQTVNLRMLFIVHPVIFVLSSMLED